MPITEVPNHRRVETIQEMVDCTIDAFKAQVSAYKNRIKFHQEHPILALLGSDSQEETYSSTLISEWQKKNCDSYCLVLQRSEAKEIFNNTYVLTPNVAFAEVLRINCYIYRPGDLFILRCPQDPWISAYFFSYLVAYRGIGLGPFPSVITFVRENAGMELVT